MGFATEFQRFFASFMAVRSAGWILSRYVFQISSIEASSVRFTFILLSHFISFIVFLMPYQ